MRLSVVLTSRQPAVTHPLLHQRLFRRAAMALVKITSAERPAISTIIIIFICYYYTDYRKETELTTRVGEGYNDFQIQQPN